jgi:hypothetical protein
LFGLQHLSGKAVVAGGLSHWHLSALAYGLAATCTGPQRLDLVLPPPDPAEPVEGEDPKGRALHTYHGAVLGCFGLGGEGMLKRARAFMRVPCDCGHHPRREPPDRERTPDHNCASLMAESRDVLLGSRRQAVARLAARAAVARETRAAIGMGRLHACWSTLEDERRQAAGDSALPDA